MTSSCHLRFHTDDRLPKRVARLGDPPETNCKSVTAKIHESGVELWHPWNLINDNEELIEVCFTRVTNGHTHGYLEQMRNRKKQQQQQQQDHHDVYDDDNVLITKQSENENTGDETQTMVGHRSDFSSGRVDWGLLKHRVWCLILAHLFPVCELPVVPAHRVLCLPLKFDSLLSDRLPAGWFVSELSRVTPSVRRSTPGAARRGAAAHPYWTELRAKCAP